MITHDTKKNVENGNITRREFLASGCLTMPAIGIGLGARSLLAKAGPSPAEIGKIDPGFIGPQFFDEHEAEALRIATGLDIDAEGLLDATRRTFLRGYAAERAQGFDEGDYSMPSEAHDPAPNMTLPYFNTHEFFSELRQRVNAIFDQRAGEAGLL